MPRSRKSRAIPLLALWASVACYRENLYLYPRPQFALMLFPASQFHSNFLDLFLVQTDHLPVHPQFSCKSLYVSCLLSLLYVRWSLCFVAWSLFFNLLKPIGHVVHQQFNIQKLYVLPTLYLSENKQRLVPLTA